MSGISTHVLDTSLGRPAAGVPVVLEIQESEGKWKRLSEGTTNADGRVASLLPGGTALVAATYRLTFDTGAYFRARGAQGFYPQVAIIFTVGDAREYHHVPLLLSPYGYSTYRGS